MAIEPADQGDTSARFDLQRLIADLRERHFFRIAAGYTVAAWLVIQVVSTIAPAFDLPNWPLRMTVLVAIIGFFATMALVIARPQRGGARSDGGQLTRRTRLSAAAALIVAAALAAAAFVGSGSLRNQVSLAVLPFSDLSETRDKAYFAEGVAEEILSNLAAEPDIQVLGRTSARQLDRNADPNALRASLGITHLLEGSTRTAGDQLRVNVRLIDTADGRQLWEEEYQGRLGDVFAVQDEIAGTVVKRLRGTFFGNAVREARATSVNAYESYLAARALMRTRSKEALTQALELARKVVAADPGYAPGQALYAELVFLLSDETSSYGTIPLARARKIAIPHARKAVELAPDRAEGYGALGLILPRDQAIAPLERAIELDPARAELRVWLGVALSELRRSDEAFEQFQAAAQVDPLWPVPITRVVQVLSASGKSDGARREIQRFLARGGDKAQALRLMAMLTSANGDLSQSVRFGRAALAADPKLPNVAQWMAADLHIMGFRAQALARHPRSTEAYERLLIAGENGPLMSRIQQDGPRIWGKPDTHVALFALGAARNWAALAALYDARPADTALCRQSPGSAALVMLAYSKVGRQGEAREIGACLRETLARAASMEWRTPADRRGGHEFAQASFAAVTGRVDEALDWLDRAVARGWLGQGLSSRLSDYPQFDLLVQNPRYAALQKRIDRTIASERAELLRDS